MDSVTHIVLGAAIGNHFLGKKIGRKGALWGALAKTLPDFDLFYTGLSDPKLYICHHRGHTHSLIWEMLYAIPLAWLLHRLYKMQLSFSTCLIFMLCCLWGHSLLDTCTNYGTRLFLPFSNEPYSWNNIAIADLVFTLPLLILLLIGITVRQQGFIHKWSFRMLWIYTFAYLGMTIIHKHVANARMDQSLSEKQIVFNKKFSNPTILNNFLWYGMAVNDSMLYVGEFSLYKPQLPIRWLAYPRNRKLMTEHPDQEDIRLLTWFSQGYTISEYDGDTLNVYCTKFGRTNMMETQTEKTFIFHYKLFQEDGVWKMGMEEPNAQNADMKEGFQDLIRRIQGIEVWKG